MDTKWHVTPQVQMYSRKALALVDGLFLMVSRVVSEDYTFFFFLRAFQSKTKCIMERLPREKAGLRTGSDSSYVAKC